ncbi:L domain-like protein [Dioscorea alata]|uniref:L domain-like protein n=1 Tax=Dioscorea alata TaxID=55571 RepID=A0ACB7VS59_DIOAL|nr:L domain-like protein [Dioscorea alata]
MKGKLCISELGKLVSVDRVIVGNLKTKSKLKDLKLNWGCPQHPDEDNVCSEQMNLSVLERLKPHCSISSLEIDSYKGCDLPALLGDPSFSKLTSIDFSSCKQIQDFPWLIARLPSLTSLSLYKFEK